MDEVSEYAPAESSPSKRRPRIRIHSMASQSSTQSMMSSGRPPRMHSPLSLRNRTSSMSLMSNGSETDRSDIIAPVPRRHHILQTHESRHWLDTPPLTASSSRPVSPLSNATTSPVQFRKNSISFSSLMAHDHAIHTSAGGSHAASQPNHKPEGEHSMARRWVRWMHKQGIKQWVVPCAILASIWVKWCVGLGSYSGQGTPPMFGDYEAQRHWMELTVHLPIRQWYTYDLQYWGLDYPPLTAYVSWLCGIVGVWLNPSWFALDSSRGIESPESKLFMRASVLVSDMIVYVPALILFIRTWQSDRSTRTQHVALLTLLLQPALLLVDFGHFQYNSVMLGFTLLSLNFFALDHDLLGAICFVLSLGFKQMALYYAPAIGAYLLAKCIYLGPVEGRRLFIRLASVTLATFVALLLPFLPPFAPASAILDPVTRIFPFARGLFEDKVANFWCASNVVFKWKIWLPRGALVKFSALLTAAGFLPSVAGLLHSGYKLQVTSKEGQIREQGKASDHTPILPLLPYALLASSMSFFLFSFQVHEKTILVPLLPLTVLLSGAASDSFTFQWGALVNNVAVFSMWPLLKRDGLGIQYVALIFLWNRLIGHNPFRSWPISPIQYLTLAVYSACLVLHALEATIAPPARLPDLYPVLNVLVSTPIFVLTWLWSIKRGVEVSWALGGLGPISHKSSHPAGQSQSSEVGKSAEVDSGGKADEKMPEAVRSTGSGRTSHMRTRSLGFAHGRRVTPRSGSVGVDAQ